MKDCIAEILRKYRIHFLIFYALYFYAVVGLLINPKINNAPVELNMMITYLVLFTAVVHFFPILIFIDSFRSGKNASTYVFWAFVANIYAVIAYVIRKDRISKLRH